MFDNFLVFFVNISQYCSVVITITKVYHSQLNDHEHEVAWFRLITKQKCFTVFIYLVTLIPTESLEYKKKKNYVLLKFHE